MRQAAARQGRQRARQQRAVQPDLVGGRGRVAGVVAWTRRGGARGGCQHWGRWALLDHNQLMPLRQACKQAAKPANKGGKANQTRAGREG